MGNVYFNGKAYKPSDVVIYQGSWSVFDISCGLPLFSNPPLSSRERSQFVTFEDVGSDAIKFTLKGHTKNAVPIIARNPQEAKEWVCSQLQRRMAVAMIRS